MACEAWKSKLDPYVDGELNPSDAESVGRHLRGCAACAADALEKVQLKRSVVVAGRTYTSSAELRAKVMRDFGGRPERTASWFWKLVIAPAALVIILSLAVGFYVNRQKAAAQRLNSELADLHVAALASTSPVDVVSTDRHTVKPWFEGKIPFTFNLPELQGTDFSLIGGKVAYLGQNPGAQLIYRLRKHEISVFIFQNVGRADLPLSPGPRSDLSFTFDSWTKDGLRYFLVGDVGSADIEALSKLLRDAG